MPLLMPRRHWTFILSIVVFFMLSGVWLLHKNDRTLIFPGRGRRPLFESEYFIQPPSLIPPKIWQLFLSKPEEDGIIGSEHIEYAASWIVMNPSYTYVLLGDQGANNFVQRHFIHEPEVIETYHNLTNVGMKSDFLRYLLLYIEGGVYTDTDTFPFKPINEWVPSAFQDDVRLIVGIEFDMRDDPPWEDIPHWVQFCQWTIVAAPGHPVFRKMIDRVLRSVKDLCERENISIDQLEPVSFDVMNSTGPAAWTDVVFEQLQEYEPTLNTTKDLSFMEEATVFGDVLVLTIDGFGMGQEHSDSTYDGTIPDEALIWHMFRGSWREEEEGGEGGEKKRKRKKKTEY